MARQINKAYLLQVNSVNRSHRVDERFARRASRSFAEHALGNGGVAHHVAVDKTHHIKRSTVDRGVGAHRQGRRYGHVGVAQRVNNAVFATHVVGARQGVR